MDWPIVLFAIEEGVPGLIALAVTLPVFVLAAEPNRILRASSASLVGIATYALVCSIAGIQGMQSSPVAEAVPLVGGAVALALVIPSTLALRWRWLGALHLLTLAALAYLFFIGSLVISRDVT